MQRAVWAHNCIRTFWGSVVVNSLLTKLLWRGSRCRGEPFRLWELFYSLRPVSFLLRNYLVPEMGDLCVMPVLHLRPLFWKHVVVYLFLLGRDVRIWWREYFCEQLRGLSFDQLLFGPQHLAFHFFHCGMGNNFAEMCSFPAEPLAF